MKFELKNVKHSKFASEETECFQASLYADGKKIGFCSNQGFGGCTDVSPFDSSCKDLVAAASLWVDENVPVEIVTDDDTGEELFTWKKKLADIVDELLRDHLLLKAIKSSLRRVCFQKESGEYYQLAASCKPTHLDDPKYNLRTRLQETHSNCIILNDLSPQEIIKDHPNF